MDTLPPPKGGRPRAKVRVAKGFSPLDWSNLTQRASDLTGGALAASGGRHLRVPMSEVARHNTEHDCWTVLRGKVYNITPFLPYHPGGSTILVRKAAGRDCSLLYDKYHPWLSPSMVDKCLIGVVVPDTESIVEEGDEEEDEDEDEDEDEGGTEASLAKRAAKLAVSAPAPTRTALAASDSKGDREPDGDVVDDVEDDEDWSDALPGPSTGTEL